MKQFKGDTYSKPSGREAVGSIFAERHSNKKNRQNNIEES